MWLFREFKFSLLFAVIGAVVLSFVIPILLPPSHAYAHRVNVFAYVLEDTIYTESYFQDGRKVIGGKIEVFDSVDRLVESGYTDKKGEYSFPIPKIGDLLIVLDASMGHRAEFRISAGEIEGEEAGRRKTEHAAQGEVSGIEESKKTSSESVSVGETGLEGIREVVREEVSRQIQPLARSVARLEKARNLSIPEILGGIGYIIGIMGVVMYLKSKGRG